MGLPMPAPSEASETVARSPTEGPGAAPRTPAERRTAPAAACLASVHDLADPPAAAYRRALSRARRDILGRLARGLLRGDPEGLPPAQVVGVGDLGVGLGGLPGGTPQPDAGALRAALPSGADEVGLLPLPGARRLVAAPVARSRGFARHDIAHPVLAAVAGGDLEPVAHPVALVDWVGEAGGAVDGDQARRVRAEVAESVANLALSLLAERVQARRWPDPVLEADPGDLPGADGPSALERLVTRGHPLHPAAKIRRGMGPAAGLAYGPEHTPEVPLRFAAIHRDLAKGVSAGGGPGITERLLAAFDGLQTAAREALPAGRRLPEYVLVPVHPWQFDHVLPARYRDERAAGDVVLVEGFDRPASPLLNLRTLAPRADPGSTGPRPPHCKTAVGVQLTNVERTLSPQAVHNGPHVTDLLGRIPGEMAGPRLGVLGELAAAGPHPPGGPHVEGEAWDHARHLGGLLRENPLDHPLAGAGDRVVPASSLVATTPGGEPLLAEAVALHADRADRASGRAAARSWWRALVEAVVPGNLRLMTACGVALEAHLQNALLVLEEGEPAALLVRDLGGIRVHAGRLAGQGLELDPYPGSDLDADGEGDLHRKLYYTLFQNLLSELAAALDRLTAVDEARLWDVAAGVAAGTFEDLRADPGVPDERVDRDEAACFGDPCTHKALTAMRLQGKRHEYVTSRVPNPLARSGTV